MLTDFLLALKERPFERVVLQTGAKVRPMIQAILPWLKPHRSVLSYTDILKNYGLHLGPVPIPCREDDPRVVGQPNFYYA